MIGTRVLVVDDSRAARLTLQRPLERYGFAVETADSGESALDFLRGATVDLIFMDHTMPGIDGLEAVDALKADSRTAAIPVVMYTAKEGDVYRDQARARGAIDVLSKRAASGELQRILVQHGFLDPGALDQSAVTTSHDPASAADADAADHADSRDGTGRADSDPSAATLAQLLAEQHQQLRADLRRQQREIAREAASIAVEHTSAPVAPRSRRAGTTPERFGHGIATGGWPIFGLVLLPFLMLLALAGGLWIERNLAISDATRRIAEAESRAATRESETRAQHDALNAERNRTAGRYREVLQTVVWALNRNAVVGFDERAFNNRRAEEVQTLLSDLAETGFRGTVRIEAHLGEFCLELDAQAEYRLAAPDTALDECALLGHPLDLSTAPEDRQSAGFASFLLSSPLVNDSGIDVELIAHDRNGSVPREPHFSNVGSAGEWNRIAARNHRIEYALIPATR